MHDYWSVERSVIILATSDNLTILAECKSWYLDGTFKSSPQLFYQILIPHAQLLLTAATSISARRGGLEERQQPRVQNLVRSHHHRLVNWLQAAIPSPHLGLAPDDAGNGPHL